MKLTFNKQNHIVAEAENKRESEELLQMAHRSARSTEGETQRKRPLHRKQCTLCDKRFKGNIGLGIHMRKSHGMSQITKLEEGVVESRPLMEMS